MATRPWKGPGVRGACRLLIRALAAAIAAALTIFHLRLLIEDLAAGQLADPGLAIRWIVSGAAVAVLGAVVRGRATLTWRPAVAGTLLVAMLHAPVLADARHSAEEAGGRDVIATLLQTALVATTLLSLAFAACARRVWVGSSVIAARLAAGTGHTSAAFLPSSSPRPPPASC